MAIRAPSQLTIYKIYWLDEVMTGPGHRCEHLVGHCKELAVENDQVNHSYT